MDDLTVTVTVTVTPRLDTKEQRTTSHEILYMHCALRIDV